MGAFVFISFKNSRIPYRDPRVKSGDNTRLGNSRILSLGILEFLGFFLGVRGYSFSEF